MGPLLRASALTGAALAAASALAVAVASAPAAPVAPTPIALPTQSEIVSRYIAWRGGEPFVRERAEHDVGDLEGLGLTGHFDIWESPGAFRTEFDLGGAREVSVATLRGSWTLDASGRIQTDPDAYKYTSRDSQSAASLRGQGGAQARLIGTEMLDGRAWAVIRIQFGDEDTYDDFIDPATGELGAVRTVERGQRRFDRLSDWRMADGVRSAMFDDAQSEAGADLRMRVSRVEIDPRVDPAIFRQPQTARQTLFAGGAATTGWIDFASDNPNRIYLPVSVNGRAVFAMLDTGSTVSAIDANLAASLGLKAAGQLPTQGENGRGDDSSLVQGVGLAIGALTYRNLTIHALDLAKLGRSSAESWPFIIGDEIFADAVVDFDFAGRRVAFWDPAAWRAPPHAVEVRLERDGPLRLVPVSLGPGAPALFLMDTGFYPNLRLAPAVTTARSLLANRPRTTMGILAIGGAANATLASLDTVTFGGVTLRNVPALFSDTWPSSSYSNRVQGLLGLGILQRFRVIVDWPHDRLFLIANPDAGGPFPRDRLGFGSEVVGKTRRITVVFPHSPAAKAGLRAGDALLSIDGRPAADVGDVASAPEGATLTLVTQRGPKSPPATMTLTARAYY